MKYYKRSMIFSEEMFLNEKEKAEAEWERYEAEWEMNENLYWLEFEKIKKRLPEAVVEVFKYSHDAEISEIQILNKEFSVDIAIHMESDLYPVKFKGTLMHLDVADFYFDTRECEKIAAFSSIGAYKYGEILREGKYWTHNFFLYINDAEIFIKCKKLEWIED